MEPGLDNEVMVLLGFGSAQVNRFPLSGISGRRQDAKTCGWEGLAP